MVKLHVSFGDLNPTPSNSEERVAWASAYPFPRQMDAEGNLQPYVFSNGAFSELPEGETLEKLLEGRIPVVGYGSNIAPIQCLRKYGDADITIPVTPMVIYDYDVAACGWTTSYGSCPGDLIPREGVAVEVGITWLTPAQIALMDDSEGQLVDPMTGPYQRLTLDSQSIFKPDADPTELHAGCKYPGHEIVLQALLDYGYADVYVGTRGVIKFGSEIASLSEVRRTIYDQEKFNGSGIGALHEMSQREILETLHHHLQEKGVVPLDEPIDAFIDSITKGANSPDYDARRLAIVEHLKPNLHQSGWEPATEINAGQELPPNVYKGQANFFPAEPNGGRPGFAKHHQEYNLLEAQAARMATLSTAQPK